MVDEQVGTRVYHPARRATKALCQQPHPTASPHQGRITYRDTPPGGVWRYTRPVQRGAAEALRTKITSHQGFVHIPRKGYNLWWQHPAPKTGLQPPADPPGLCPELTAIAHIVATMAQVIEEPPKWTPGIIT